MDIDPKVKALIDEMKSVGRLPALDRNVGALCSLADNPATQAADLTAIILRDPALTSNILSVANSVAYRSLTAIRTVSAAVILLGFEKIQALALGLSIFKQSRENARTRELYRLFTCSYFTGTLSRPPTAIRRRPLSQACSCSCPGCCSPTASRNVIRKWNACRPTRSACRTRRASKSSA